MHHVQSIMASFFFFPQIVVSWWTVFGGLWPDIDTPDPKNVQSEWSLWNLSLFAFTYLNPIYSLFFPSYCCHVGLHHGLVCLFHAFSFILCHISAEALPHLVPSENIVDLAWRVMMDKLVQTSKGCAQHSRSQERSFMHTHTLTHKHLQLQQLRHHSQIIKTWQCVIFRQADVSLRGHVFSR